MIRCSKLSTGAMSSATASDRRTEYVLGVTSQNTSRKAIIAADVTGTHRLLPPDRPMVISVA